MRSLMQKVTLVGSYANGEIDAAFVPSKHQWLSRPETGNGITRGSLT